MTKQIYGLLTETQVFGPSAIDVIRRLGTVCEATDYAVLTGAQVADAAQFKAGTGEATNNNPSDTVANTGDGSCESWPDAATNTGDGSCKSWPDAVTGAGDGSCKSWPDAATNTGDGSCKSWPGTVTNADDAANNAWPDAITAAPAKGWAGRWFLSSAAGYGDVCTVNADGTRGVSYANAVGGLRPVLLCAGLSGKEDRSELETESAGRGEKSDSADPEPPGAGGSEKDAGGDNLLPCSRIRKDISGFLEAEHGEYPQDAADRTLARTMESDFAKGRLRRTGKVLDGAYPEYVRDGGKFIRATYRAAEPRRLSNGRTYRPGDPVWIRVQPVKWLYDETAGLLVSRKILRGGIRFSAENHYEGEFGSTELHEYLRTRFCEDMLPSVLREMTAEEKAAYEEDIKRAEQRRNPYGLTFGEVSEEDIIRGAIESDIAVFLHGPSSEGKSARIKQIDPTCEIIYLRNATPDSLNGRSVYNQATGEMIDIPPTWYKKVVAKCEAEPDTFHVVFFDEINNALPSIQGMAFNIVLDREVNGLWKLPPNARVVAAGNDMQDSLAANQIAAPFFNRFAHVYINTTTEKWLRWAKENRIHPAIYSYIAYRRGETLRSEYDGEKPNADPRKWEMASKMLYATGRPEMLRALIGEEITEEFVRFCNQPVITLADVLSGNYTDREIAEMNTAERYATTMGLSQADEEHLEQLEIVRAFVSKLGEEYRAIFDELMAPGDAGTAKAGAAGDEDTAEDSEDIIIDATYADLDGAETTCKGAGDGADDGLDDGTGDGAGDGTTGDGSEDPMREDDPEGARPDGEGREDDPVLEKMLQQEDSEDSEAKRRAEELFRKLAEKQSLDDLLQEMDEMDGKNAPEGGKGQGQPGDDAGGLDDQDLDPEDFVLMGKTVAKPGNSIQPDVRPMDRIGNAPPLIDWRLLLRDTINYGVDWSFTNAVLEDGIVRPALEEVPMPETEIVLDTSWSVEEDLLRNFLRECKNILQLSKLKAGCFDTVFYGFQEIRTEKDIEEMTFEGGGGTDFNVAAQAFTMRVDNRIIFTDGEADMPDEPLNAIWVVCGEKEIEPEGGTVIHITPEQMERLRG